jgi:hypothetical protein
LAGIEIQEEADAMREWAKANANRSIARKADWDETFGGFLRRLAKEKKEKEGMNGPPRPANQPALQPAEGCLQPSQSKALAKSTRLDPEKLRRYSIRWWIGSFRH